MIEGALWRWHRRGGALEWVALLVWTALAFRIFASSGMSASGGLDDLAVVLGGVVAFGLLGFVSPRARAAALFAIGLALIVVYGSSLLFYRFYRSYVRFGTLSMIGATPGGLPAIEALFTPDFVIGCVAIPLLLLLLATERAAAKRGHNRLAFVLAAAMLLFVLIARGGGDREGFAAADTNPVGYLVRDTIAALRTLAPTLLDVLGLREANAAFPPAFESITDDSESG